MKRLTRYGLLVAAMLVGVALLSSCGKVEDSIARITVVNSATNQPIEGAVVRLVPESSLSNPPDYDFPDGFPEDVTNSDGVAEFDFTERFQEGQAGLMVLTIEVVDGSTEYEDVAIIKIEEEQVNEKTVFVP